MVTTYLSWCVGIIVSVAAFSATAESSVSEKVQGVLEVWLAERAPIEKVTGIAAYVSLGDPRPAVEAFAGTVGRAPSGGAVSQDTLFQMAARRSRSRLL